MKTCLLIGAFFVVVGPPATQESHKGDPQDPLKALRVLSLQSVLSDVRGELIKLRAAHDFLELAREQCSAMGGMLQNPQFEVPIPQEGFLYSGMRDMYRKRRKEAQDILKAGIPIQDALVIAFTASQLLGDTLPEKLTPLEKRVWDAGQKKKDRETHVAMWKEADRVLKEAVENMVRRIAAQEKDIVDLRREIKNAGIP